MNRKDAQKEAIKIANKFCNDGAGFIEIRHEGRVVCPYFRVYANAYYEHLDVSDDYEELSDHIYYEFDDSDVERGKFVVCWKDDSPDVKSPMISSGKKGSDGSLIVSSSSDFKSCEFAENWITLDGHGVKND